MYGPWQFGRMSLDQYWEKHSRIVESMRAVDPTIKVVLSGASICERSIGGAEKKGNFFPSEWEPPIPEKLPWELGGHEDWTGWLLANNKGKVDIVSEHTYSYPRLSYDAQKQLFVDSQDPLPIQARRISNRVGEVRGGLAEVCREDAVAQGDRKSSSASTSGVAATGIRRALPTSRRAC